MSRALILGATGTINNLVTREIVSMNSDTEVRLTSTRADGVAQLKVQFPNTEVCLANYDNHRSLTSALAGVDKVMVVNPDMIDEADASSSLLAAIDAVGGVQQLVRLVTHPPGLSLRDLKTEIRSIPIGFIPSLIAKKILDASLVPLTFVNVVSAFMSNLFWSADLIRNDRKLAMPANHAQTWIHPADVAASCARILVDNADWHIGKTYELSGADVWSFDEIAELLTEELGVSITYSDDDELINRVFGEDSELFVRYFEIEKEYYSGVRSNCAVKTLVGRPPHSIRHWIRENREQFM